MSGLIANGSELRNMVFVPVQNKKLIDELLKNNFKKCDTSSSTLFPKEVTMHNSSYDSCDFVILKRKE